MFAAIEENLAEAGIVFKEGDHHGGVLHKFGDKRRRSSREGRGPRQTAVVRDIPRVLRQRRSACLRRREKLRHLRIWVVREQPDTTQIRHTSGGTRRRSRRNTLALSHRLRVSGGVV